MCNLFSNCKKPSQFNVEKKAFMAKKATSYDACEEHAASIGSRAPSGPVINMAGMESKFYKITAL